MKVLFSTKYLAAMLRKALLDKGFNRIDFNEENWILKRQECIDIKLKVEHTTDSCKDELQSLNIDRAQWFNLMTFLEKLPEQPIVLELMFFGNDDVEIKLSQFIAKF